MRFLFSFLVLLIAFPLVAAPAPLPRKKPDKPFTLVGDWHWDWGTTKTTVSFTKDGGYYTPWCGTPWQGTWKLEKEEKDDKGRRVFSFEIQERAIPLDGTPPSPGFNTVKMVVMLDEKTGVLTGKINGSIEDNCKLVRIKP